MDVLTSIMHSHGRIMRRQDLLRAGLSDRDIRWALALHRIFRVRHGWYATPDIADDIAHTIRVGGRLTGLSALRTHGLYLPRPAVLDIVVPRSAAGLRRPTNRHERLHTTDRVRLHWTDPPRRERSPSDWRVSDEDSLLCVLRNEGREVAIACCDALVRYRGWSRARLASVFARAPRRVRVWLDQVDGRADSWGESVVRLRLRDAGVLFEPQVFVAGVGRLDGRVSPHVFVEVDGKQHAEDWVGGSASSFENDHDRDVALAERGARAIRITYRQIDESWDACVRAIRRAIEDDRDARTPSTARP